MQKTEQKAEASSDATSDHATASIAEVRVGQTAKLRLIFKIYYSLLVVTYRQVFSNADWIDFVLILFGTFGALVVGVSNPAMDLLFGRILNSLNNSDEFMDDIDTLCLYLVIIAGFNFVAGFLQVRMSTILLFIFLIRLYLHIKLQAQIYCWTRTGERQAQRFRECYVNAILSQEIGWFDDCGAGELSTRVAEVIGKIQDGTGRKAGEAIQLLSQLVASYILALYLDWRLTLVMFASFPLLAGAGTVCCAAAIGTFQF